MRTSSVGGSTARIRARSALELTDGDAATTSSSHWPGSPAMYCACAGVTSATPAPPNDAEPANLTIPAIR